MELGSQEFLNELRDWLLLTNDPRVELSASGGRINSVVSASADFCGFMAQLEERGIPAKEWRSHLSS
jgi:hypothetical protein